MSRLAASLGLSLFLATALVHQPSRAADVEIQFLGCQRVNDDDVVAHASEPSHLADGGGIFVEIGNDDEEAASLHDRGGPP